MNLVSRISQDVRTATTTADIRELHQAVQSGTYTPDPHAIASRMLFFAEA
jgi:anti-sigma28 factor (negative regulator of flagellin synthesis)